MLFSISLQAVDELRNCRRSYHLAVERDLLGDWIVSFTYGRIGCRGRTLTIVADDELHARRLARTALRRRVSAPRRIGVAYRPTKQFSVFDWQDLAAELERPIGSRRG